MYYIHRQLRQLYVALTVCRVGTIQCTWSRRTGVLDSDLGWVWGGCDGVGNVGSSAGYFVYTYIYIRYATSWAGRLLVILWQRNTKCRFILISAVVVVYASPGPPETHPSPSITGIREG